MTQAAGFCQLNRLHLINDSATTENYSVKVATQKETAMTDNFNNSASVAQGEALAMRAERELQRNPSANLVQFLRNDLASYKQTGDSGAYNQVVSSMTAKLEKDGLLPMMALQAGMEDFDDISRDHKTVSKDALIYSKKPVAANAFEAFLDDAGRNYMQRNFDGLKNQKREGWGKFFGNSEISRKDMMKAIDKEQEQVLKHKLPYVSSTYINFEPPKPVKTEPQKLEVPKLETKTAEVKKEVLPETKKAAETPIASTQYKVKPNDTLNEIITAKYKTLPKADQDAAMQLIIQLNPSIKNINQIRVDDTLNLPTEVALVSHARKNRGAVVRKQISAK